MFQHVQGISKCLREYFRYIPSQCRERAVPASSLVSVLLQVALIFAACCARTRTAPLDIFGPTTFAALSEHARMLGRALEHCVVAWITGVAPKLHIRMLLPDPWKAKSEFRDIKTDETARMIKDMTPIAAGVMDSVEKELRELLPPGQTKFVKKGGIFADQHICKGKELPRGHRDREDINVDLRILIAGGWLWGEMKYGASGPEYQRSQRGRELARLRAIAKNHGSYQLFYSGMQCTKDLERPRMLAYLIVWLEGGGVAWEMYTAFVDKKFQDEASAKPRYWGKVSLDEVGLGVAPPPEPAPQQLKPKRTEAEILRESAEIFASMSVEGRRDFMAAIDHNSGPKLLNFLEMCRGPFRYPPYDDPKKAYQNVAESARAFSYCGSSSVRRYCSSSWKDSRLFRCGWESVFQNVAGAS